MLTTRSVRMALMLFAVVLLGIILRNHYRRATKQAEGPSVAGVIVLKSPILPSESALCKAVRAGDLAQVKRLLAHHADVNVWYGEPLRLAIKLRNRRLVQELLQYGANVNPSPPSAPPPSSSQRTSETDYAYWERQRAAFHTVSSQYPSARPQLDPISPLMTAVCYAPECEALLRKVGATIGPDRDTILADAVYSGHQELLARLLACGANINGFDREGETALTQAIVHMPAAVPFLLEHGANPNCVTRAHETPLEIAAYAGDSAIARLLLTRKADVNAHYGIGHTPLYWARKKNHAALVEILQKAGATQDL